MVPITCDLIANLDVVRVTKLDACGKPIPGPNAFISECVASIAMNPNIDTPDDVLYRAANGNLCGVKRGCPTLLGYDTEFNFFQVSPELVDVLTSSPLVLDNIGDPAGWDDCSIKCDGGFALEFWAELVGQACSATGLPKFLYVLMPWISNGYISDLSIGSEAVTFQLLGSTRAGGQWGVGPYNVVLNGTAPGTPGPLLTPLGSTCHRRIQTTTVAPPTPDPNCDYTTVPTPAP